MGQLTRKEQDLMKRLQDKLEGPDTPAVGRSLNATIDLADPKQVALAIKHGFLPPDDDLDDDEDDSDEEVDDAPRRRSYFKEASQ